VPLPNGARLKPVGNDSAARNITFGFSLGFAALNLVHSLEKGKFLAKRVGIKYFSHETAWKPVQESSPE
jgi:hypothetical protein